MKMKKILYCDPAIASLNIGDHIISTSAKEQLKDITKNNFVTEISTHLPTSYYYMRLLKDVDYSFVLGSNLLKSTHFGFKRQWDIKMRQFYLKPSILVGAGWWQYGNKPNLYTKLLYKKVLDKNVLHSVRDDYTMNTLQDMGFKNVINTSCSTMWKFTDEYNDYIPKYKSDNVVFTLTDYNKSESDDQKLVNILLNNYQKIYFWPQGIGDYEYLQNLLGKEVDKIEIISPDLSSYDYLLDNKDIEFIGTRLHGGIRALQKGKRTLILSVDNRAEEKKKDFNLPVVSRENFKEIEKFVERQFITNIHTPQKNIKIWKDQFGIK
ncbi:polysaccharide pyruvyl transferase family protein [Enterococcus sp. RIT-PI-f]